MKNRRHYERDSYETPFTFRPRAKATEGLTIPAIIMSWSASSCFFLSSFSASCSCFSMLFTSLSRSVTSAKVLSASALVLVAFWAQKRRWLVKTALRFLRHVPSHSSIYKMPRKYNPARTGRKFHCVLTYVIIYFFNP